MVTKVDRKRRSSPARRRILIVDDHPMTRYGMAQLISQEPDLEVCGELESARTVLASVKSLRPDLVLADLTMPGKSGLELVKELKAHHPDVPVLMVTMHEERAYAERILRAGAKGYLMKSAGGEKLLRAIRRVLGGEVYLSETMLSLVVDGIAGRRRTTKDESTVAALTEREFEVFELMGRGLMTREIALRLHISVKTVETHRGHCAEKLRCRGTAELLKFALRWVRAQELS